MQYDLEWKIKWEELSPSLQKKFTDEVNSRMTSDKEIWGSDTWYKDSDIKNKKNIYQIWASLDKILADFSLNKEGMPGQVYKISKTLYGIDPDDNFRKVQVVDNESDFYKMVEVAEPVSLKQVFNEWYRFAHTDETALAPFSTPYEESNSYTVNGSNSWQNLGYTDCWSFDETSSSITKTVDWSPLCGFISPASSHFFNYYLRTKCEFNDEDMFGLICGFTKDSSGKEHTLILGRWGYNNPSSGNSYADGHWRYILIYDMGNPTQHVIIDKSSVISNSSNSGYVYISMKRNGNLFEFKSSDVNSSTDNEAYTFTFSYPDTFASAQSLYPGMTQAEYDNIGSMLNSTARLGFCAFAMTLTFYIDTQYEIFDDNYIYRLDTNQAYKYSTSSKNWSVYDAVSNLLPDRILMYNSKLEKLFFYFYRGKYVEIAPYKSIIEDTISTANYPPKGSSIEYGSGGQTGMVKRLDKENSITFWEDYFHIVRVTTSTSEVTYEKSLNIDLADVFNKWKRVASSSSANGVSPKWYALPDDTTYQSILNAYKYSDTYATIINTNNSDLATAFISNTKYDNNWMIKIKITRDSTIYSSVGSSPDDDDDILFVLAGVIDNDDGTFSDIGIGRIAGDSWAYSDTGSHASFFICYNILPTVGSDWGHIYADNILARMTLPHRAWKNGECYVRIEKTEGKLVAYTSDIGSVTDINSDYKIEYTLPNVKPSNYSDKKWEDLNKLLNSSTSSIGFGTRSNAGAFQIVDQKYLFNDEIYDLSTDTVWKYQDGTWVKIGNISNKIPPRSLLYNKRTKKMIWYLSPDDYTELEFS